jgi:hypothetical protein
MAIGIGWVRSQSHPVLPAEPTLPSASVAAAPKPAPKPTAVATAKPTASAAAAPAKDGKDLPATKGYLVVTFAKDADAHVFSRVSDQGKVNEPLAVDCTQAHFLRIGKGDPPTWLTDGRAGVTVKCQAVTEITMRPPLR